ncbi:Hpt domain-containing protein [Natronolimnohabitans innermongolicus]|uniref:Chemotaxis protein CheA n=1 Tax=Natronolimnohabitans innermongolicus JCM 12255 TaxID=1227499 RepID=L9XGK4_9EURY|nr:Hpt domain-containing protein [Natronolimnohabitans innermongolicus]ELY60747.1 chemotaxis protein CheA [Natronolimnohabitans innermongolicus JCM 12255]
MTEYVTDFVQESEERITELNNALLTLERKPTDDEAMENIFRVAHTLKGNCGAMGLESASDLAHAIEDLLDAVRSGDLDVTPELMDSIFDAVDELETMVDEIATTGDIETDPSATIAALRGHLEDESGDVGGSTTVAAPSTDEIDAVVEQFEPPADDDHEAYLVRLAVADETGVNHGSAVVDALVDAFDLIGTDPPRDAIEAGEYDGRFDAVFGSAVGETAITSGLEPVEEVADFELVTVSDRFAALAQAQTEAEADVDTEAETDPDATGDATADDGLSSEDAADLEVDDLLDEFDEFDDLDGMVEDLDDDDLEPFDEMGEAGAFDDLLEGDEMDVDPVLDESAAPNGDDHEGDAADSSVPASSAVAGDEVADRSDSSGSDTETGTGTDADTDASDDVEDASAVFDELKDEVEMVGFDELQDELDDLEFDEFDSDDEVGMDELIGDDVDVDDDSFLEGAEPTDDELDELLVDEPTAEDDDELLTDESSVADSVDSDDTSEATAAGDASDDAQPAGDRFGDEPGASDDSPADDDAVSSSAVDAADEAHGKAEHEAHGGDERTTPADDPSVSAAEATDSTEESDPATDFEAAFEDEFTTNDEGNVSDEAGDAFSAADSTTETDVSDDESAAGAFDETADPFGDAEFDESASAELDDETDADSAFEAAFDDEFTDDSGEMSADEFADDGFDDGLEDDAFEDLDDEFGIDVADDVFGDDEFDDALADDFEADFGTGLGDTGFDEFGGGVETSETAESATDAFGADSTLEGGDDTEAGADADTVTTRVDEPALGTPELTIPDGPDRPDANQRSDEVQSVRVDVDQIDSLLTLVEGLVTTRVRLRHAVTERDGDDAPLETELDDLEDLTTDLQETVMDIRLVPLQTVTNRLPRVVRDIAREQDKDVAFEITGEEIELDRSILDRIGDPLIHLVRNAVDHGIEPPEERAQTDKPADGSVEVRAERSRDRVTITVEDDGSGLDPDRLRSEAVAADVLTEDEAAALPDDEAYDLIFHPGLSTADEVTDVSGRGVGMDVVKRTVDDLEGTVSIDSDPGEGTSVTMTLPVSVAIDDILFVECGGEEFGVPTKAVQDIEPASALEASDGGSTVVDPESVIRLDEVLETPRSGVNGDGMLVRIRDEVRPVALHCDHVHGQQEVVVKPFEGFMGDIPGLSGATVRGRGEVVNILDVNTL